MASGGCEHGQPVMEMTIGDNGEEEKVGSGGGEADHGVGMAGSHDGEDKQKGSDMWRWR